MTLRGVFRRFSLMRKANGFFVSGSSQTKPARPARFGLGLSGRFPLGVGLWVLIVNPFLLLTEGLAPVLFALGIFNLLALSRNRLSLLRANELCLGGYTVSRDAMYFFASRFVMVSYMT